MIVICESKINFKRLPHSFSWNFFQVSFVKIFIYWSDILNWLWNLKILCTWFTPFVPKHPNLLSLCCWLWRYHVSRPISCVVHITHTSIVFTVGIGSIKMMQIGHETTYSPNCEASINPVSTQMFVMNELCAWAYKVEHMTAPW